MATSNHKPNHMPSLAAVTTPFPHHIDVDAPLSEASEMMSQHKVHHLAVTRDGDLETVISANDIDRAYSPGHRFEEQDLYVRDVCARRPYIADIHDPLDKILLAMADTHIGCVLVMREGELVGIVTVADALRYCAKHLAELYSPIDDEVA